MQTYDRFTEAFPAEANAVEVVVEADDVRGGEVAAAIDELVAQAEASKTCIGRDRGRAISDDGTVASVAIPTDGNGTDDESMAALDELRDELSRPRSARSRARRQRHRRRRPVEDFSDLLADRMPLVFAFVLGLAFLLLLVTFRSIVIPIKAIVLNLLSVGAAYGVLVLVFQNGLGRVAARLRVERRHHHLAAPVPVRDPVRALDGLPRVHPEPGPGALRPGYEHRRRGPQGHRGTAGTVTSAAVVMVAVFSVFATLSFIDLKQMGIGPGGRDPDRRDDHPGVLLPATMKLLGDWNWYLPKALGWLPTDPGRVRIQADGRAGPGVTPNRIQVATAAVPAREGRDLPPSA